MKGYYQDLITEKSWQILIRLKSKIDFVLIGGWAVYLYTKGLKSKDIDTVIDYDNLGKLQKIYPVSKNHHLKKYEVKNEEVDIDIYLPFYSILPIPVEELPKLTVRYDNFTVLKKEALLILKQKAYENRKASIKGQKDRIDIISLIILPDFDLSYYQELLKKYKSEMFYDQAKELVMQTKTIPELSLNQHRLAKIKKGLLRKLI